MAVAISLFGLNSGAALATVVGDRRVLLVLDNLEQVLAAGEDIAALSARCPQLQIVVTSRAPLRKHRSIIFSVASARAGAGA